MDFGYYWKLRSESQALFTNAITAPEREIDFSIYHHLPHIYSTQKCTNFSGEQLAEFSSLITTIGFYSIILEHHALSAKAHLLKTWIALERAHLNGASPATTLSSLVPTYLSSVPIDPFDQNPVKLNTKERIIYSIGTDHIDLSGFTQSTGVFTDLEEIAISVPQ